MKLNNINDKLLLIPIFLSAVAKVNNSSEIFTIIISDQVIYTLTESLFSQKIDCKVNSVFTFQDTFKLFLSESDRGDNVLTNFCLLIDTNSDANLHVRFVSYRDRRDFYMALSETEKISNVYEMLGSRESEEEVDLQDNNKQSTLNSQSTPSTQDKTTDIGKEKNEVEHFNEDEGTDDVIVLDDDRDENSLKDSESSSSEEFSIYDQYNS